MCVWSLAFDCEASVHGYDGEAARMSGRLVSGSADGTIHVWDLETSSSVFGPLRGHRSTVWCVDVSNSSSLTSQSIIRKSIDTYIVSGGEDMVVNIWSGNTGEIKQTFRTHSSAVRYVRFSPHYGALASASSDGTIHMHYLNFMTDDLESNSTNSYSMMDQTTTFTLTWETFITHTTRYLDGCPHRGIPYHTSAVTCLRFGRRMCPDYRTESKSLKFNPVLTSCGLDGKIWIHEIPICPDMLDETNKQEKDICLDQDNYVMYHRGSVTCCDVIHLDVCKQALDCQSVCCGELMLIVTGGLDNSIKVWTCATDALMVCDLAFSYGNVKDLKQRRYIKEAKEMIGSDMEKLTCLMTISGTKENMSGHQAALSNVQFLDNGHTIMSSSVDGEVRFWDLNLLLRLHLTEISLEHHVLGKEVKSKRRVSVEDDGDYKASGIGFGLLIMKFFCVRLTNMLIQMSIRRRTKEKQQSESKSGGGGDGGISSSTHFSVSRSDHRAIAELERSILLAFAWVVLETRSPWPSAKRRNKLEGALLQECELHAVHRE